MKGWVIAAILVFVSPVALSAGPSNDAFRAYLAEIAPAIDKALIDLEAWEGKLGGDVSNIALGDALVEIASDVRFINRKHWQQLPRGSDARPWSMLTTTSGEPAIDVNKSTLAGVTWKVEYASGFFANELRRLAKSIYTSREDFDEADLRRTDLRIAENNLREAMAALKAVRTD